MPLDTSRIRALCFDVDGTLSDTDDYYVSRITVWLDRLGFIRDPLRMARRLVMWVESPGNALLGFADTLGVDEVIIALINWMYRHRRRQNRPFPVIPGVEALLDELDQHYLLAVVSARDETSTQAFLRQRNLARYFDVVITALSAPHTKPYPDPIQLAARRMGVDTSACVMVGDTTVDVRAGRAAGSQTVGVLCGFGEKAELEQQGVDCIVACTTDLARVLFPKH